VVRNRVLALHLVMRHAVSHSILIHTIERVRFRDERVIASALMSKHCTCRAPLACVWTDFLHFESSESDLDLPYDLRDRLRERERERERKGGREGAK
jgi:hypothetical protein